MTKNTLTTEVRSRIEAFLEEVSGMLKQAALDSVRAALGDDSTPARRGPGRPAGKSTAARRGPGRPKSKGGKRTSEEVDQMAERILAFVKSTPGQGLETISKKLGIATKELKLPVIKLLSARQLKKTGQKRGTKYFAGGSGSAVRKATKKSARKTGGKGKKGKRGPRRTRVMAAAA